MVSQPSKNITRIAFWQVVCTVAALLLLGSVWIALSEKNKEAATTSPLQQVLSWTADAQDLIRPSQALNTEFEKHLQAALQNLSVWVDDNSPLPPALKVKLSGYKTEMETLLAEKGNVMGLGTQLGGTTKLQGIKTNSVAGKDFLSALQQWTVLFQGVTETSPPTWEHITQSQAAWMRVASSLQTLQQEAQSANAKNAKIANELLSVLKSVAAWPAIESHAQALDKLLQARARLEQGLSQQLSAEEAAVTRPFGWHRLGYPADPLQGLWIAAGLLLASLTLGWSVRTRPIMEAKASDNTSPPQTRQDLLAHKEWLGLLLHQREEAELALAHLVEAGNKLGEVMLESHEPLFQLIWEAKNQAPIETHEQNHLKQASVVQTQLHEEVQRLQEKLINVHLQFCQGSHQDNLMYDLAYLADAFKGLIGTTEQISRILQQGAQPAADATSRPQPDEKFAERLDAWRAQLREVTRQMNEAQTLLGKSLKMVQHEEPRASVFGPDVTR